MVWPARELASRWTGDLEDDCCLRVGDFLAHVELMGDFKAQMDGKGSRYEMVEYWFFAVYCGDETIFHTGDVGGMICSGDLCRAICETIIKAHLGEGKSCV